MDRWASETGGLHCLGGWVIVLSGIPIRVTSGQCSNSVYIPDVPQDMRAPLLHFALPETVDSESGETRVRCSEVARFLLGTDYWTSRELFYNDAPSARRILNDLISKEESCPTPN